MHQSAYMVGACCHHHGLMLLFSTIFMLLLLAVMAHCTEPMLSPLLLADNAVAVIPFLYFSCCQFTIANADVTVIIGVIITG